MASGNYRYEELVAEADLLISIAALSDLIFACINLRVVGKLVYPMP